jgi:hypothetical protein
MSDTSLAGLVCAGPVVLVAVINTRTLNLVLVDYFFFIASGTPGLVPCVKCKMYLAFSLKNVSKDLELYYFGMRECKH